MKRLGVTQRVSTNFHNSAHDCLDQSWADLCLSIEAEIVPLPNLDAKKADIGQFLSLQNLSGLILSGGNDIHGLGEILGSQSSVRRDEFEREGIAWARSEAIPMLGVCRGMQFLNHVMGGKLTTTAGHAGSRHEIQAATNGPLRWFDVLPASWTVNSFHTFAIAKEGLAKGLHPAALDAQGQIEAFYHSKEPIAGVMWHPERENPFNAHDINFLRMFFQI